MKKQAVVFFYILLFLSGGLFAVGEKVFTIGAGSSWQAAEVRQGITEISAVRPYPVLALSSSRTGEPYGAASFPDLVLSFDEGGAALFTDQTGHYQVLASETAIREGNLSAAGPSLARAGNGAVFFPPRVPAAHRSRVSAAPLPSFPGKMPFLPRAGRFRISVSNFGFIP
jgi:hypothetical protein